MLLEPKQSSSCVLQCVAVCCSVLQCAAMRCSVQLEPRQLGPCVLQFDAAVCCSVLLCVAVYYRVLKADPYAL